MKSMKSGILGLVALLILGGTANSMNWAANWIWQPTDGPANTWVSFRKTVDLATVPSTVVANIGVDSKYWLWIKGKLVQFEGSAGRGPTPRNTWYVGRDIQPDENPKQKTTS